jgi:phage shock protein PspC (stress-responsive transcriptional regulator)
MFCTRCGQKLDDLARFCTRCGKPVAGDYAAASAAATEPPPYPHGYPPGYPAAYPPGYGPATETKKLRRILRGKKIAGVCTGYAEYFNMDLTLMRLIWVGLLLVPPNIGLIAYIVSWIVLPTEE